ncbi:MAG: YdcF family protein [Anaerolineae bacterium]|nr:YdcF family protein [Anaerolineae bacterium]
MARYGVALTVLVALGLLFVNLWLRVSAQAQKDEARRADVIIILGCAVWPGERPSPSLEARVQHGIVLYQRGMADYIVLSGAIGRYPPAEAEVMRRLAVGHGVPEQSLILDTESRSTIESIQRAGSTMQEHTWNTAIIVSDPFHIYRALMMARDEGIRAWGSPALNSPTYTIPRLRYYYTLREVLAIAHYQFTRLF